MHKGQHVFVCVCIPGTDISMCPAIGPNMVEVSRWVSVHEEAIAKLAQSLLIKFVVCNPCLCRVASKLRSF